MNPITYTWPPRGMRVDGLRVKEADATTVGEVSLSASKGCLVATPHACTLGCTDGWTTAPVSDEYRAKTTDAVIRWTGERSVLCRCADVVERACGRINRAGIPGRHARAVLPIHAPEECLRVAETADRLTAGDIGILMHGDLGAGKSFIAAWALLNAMRRGARGRWVTLDNLDAMVRDGYSSKRSQIEVLAPYIDADILVLDEVSPTAGRPHACEILSRLMRERYEREMPTILTTNATPDEFFTFFDERVADRLRATLKVHEINAANYRDQRRS